MRFADEPVAEVVMAAVEEAQVLEDVLDANIDRLLDASDFTFRLRFRNPVAWRPGLMENDILGESRLLQERECNNVLVYKKNLAHISQMLPGLVLVLVAGTRYQVPGYSGIDIY